MEALPSRNTIIVETMAIPIMIPVPIGVVQEKPEGDYTWRARKRRSNWNKGQRMMDENLSEYGNLRGNCKLYRIWIR